MRKLAWIAGANVALVLTVVLGSGLLGGQGVSSQGTVNFDVPLTLVPIDIDPDHDGLTSGEEYDAAPTPTTPTPTAAAKTMAPRSISAPILSTHLTMRSSPLRISKRRPGSVR